MQESVGFIVLGGMIAAIGGGIMAAGTAGEAGWLVFIGVVVIAIGGVMAQVGTIAAGVILGLRESRR